MRDLKNDAPNDAAADSEVPDLFRLSVLLHAQGQRLRCFAAARPHGRWGRWSEEMYQRFLTDQWADEHCREALDELMTQAEATRLEERLWKIQGVGHRIIATELERISAPWVEPGGHGVLPEEVYGNVHPNYAASMLEPIDTGMPWSVILVARIPPRNFRVVGRERPASRDRVEPSEADVRSGIDEYAHLLEQSSEDPADADEGASLGQNSDSSDTDRGGN